jgi:hypothetical protein
MAIVYEISGYTPPAADLEPFYLPEGRYSVKNTDPGASLDWGIYSASGTELVGGTEAIGSIWWLDIAPSTPQPLRFRVTPYGNGGPFRLVISDSTPDPETLSVTLEVNQDSSDPTLFYLNAMVDYGSGNYVYYWNFGNGTSGWYNQGYYEVHYPYEGYYTIEVEVTDLNSEDTAYTSYQLYSPGESPGPEPEPEPYYYYGGTPPPYYVYEIDKGWSFDGMYIPCFLELNWYFGDNPFNTKTIQKVRIHGTTAGNAHLSVSVSALQDDYEDSYTEPQHIDLPRQPRYVTSELEPVTNYVDSSNWGVALQMKFEGRNTDVNLPEPVHVLQVLALQSSPQDNGSRIN